jgi:ATP-dependent Clp protease protease subunit
MGSGTCEQCGSSMRDTEGTGPDGHDGGANSRRPSSRAPGTPSHRGDDSGATAPRNERTGPLNLVYLRSEARLPPAVRADRGERTFDSFIRLREDRIIFLGMPVDDQIASVIIAQMRFLEREDPERAIRLYINSPGGDVVSGLAIYDTMVELRPAVVTACLGLAAGMAAVLLSAGTKGRRLALPDSRVMTTQSSVGFQGAVPDFEVIAREAIKLTTRMIEVLARHSGQPFDTVVRDTERDYYMTAHEAREYGIVDEVLERRQLPGQRSTSS